MRRPLRWGIANCGREALSLLRRAVILMSMLLITACGTFEPETIEGAQCKQECSMNMQNCSMNMQNCTASEETCETAFGHCIDSCEDIDRLSR